MPSYCWIARSKELPRELASLVRSLDRAVNVLMSWMAKVLSNVSQHVPNPNGEFKEGTHINSALESSENGSDGLADEGNFR